MNLEGKLCNHIEGGRKESNFYSSREIYLDLSYLGLRFLKEQETHLKK